MSSEIFIKMIFQSRKVYKHTPNHECERFGQKNSLEIKTLFVINPEINSGKGIGTKLLDYITNKAKEAKASALHVTVSEKKPESLSFFQKKSFKIIQSCDDLYVKGSKEYVLQKLLTEMPRQRIAVSPIRAPLIEHDYRPITLKKCYIQMIAQKIKTIEGRINSGLFQRIRSGDRIRFFAGPDEVYCQVTKIANYKSFPEMLQNEGYQKLIPDARNLEDAIRIYDRIPGYSQRAQASGVLALHVQVEPKPLAPLSVTGKRKREDEVMPMQPAPFYRR